MNRLELRCEEKDGAAVITVAGDLTIHSAPRLREMLAAGPGTDPRPVVVDLTAVTFLDSTGVAVLVGARRRLAAGGERLAVVAASEPADVLRVLRTTGLLDVLGVCASAEEALAKVNAADEPAMAGGTEN